jgi:hypothetical protein
LNGNLAGKNELKFSGKNELKFGRKNVMGILRENCNRNFAGKL